MSPALVGSGGLIRDRIGSTEWLANAFSGVALEDIWTTNIALTIICVVMGQCELLLRNTLLGMGLGIRLGMISMPKVKSTLALERAYFYCGFAVVDTIVGRYFNAHSL